jgi:hypothetical protein
MGFQYARDGQAKMFRNERDEIIPVDPDEYLVEVFTRKAFEFLGQKDERPFFLYLSYYPPHWPLEVPERYLEPYQDIEDVHRRTACAMIASVDKSVKSWPGLRSPAWRTTPSWFSSATTGRRNTTRRT